MQEEKPPHSILIYLKNIIIIALIMVFYFTIFSPTVKIIKDRLSRVDVNEGEETSTLTFERAMEEINRETSHVAEKKEAIPVPHIPDLPVEKIIREEIKSEPVKKSASAKPKSAPAPKKIVSQPAKTAKAAPATKSILNVNIPKTQETKIIKKSFQDAPKTTSKKSKKNEAPITDAYAWRENPEDLVQTGKPEPIERIILLTDNIKQSKTMVVGVIKELKGEVVSSKGELVSFYIPNDNYAEFVDFTEQMIGEIIRPAAGAYEEVELKKKNGMISMGIEIKLKP